MIKIKFGFLIPFFSLILMNTVSASTTWKVVTHAGLEPFVYYNEEREFIGIDIDIADLLAEELDVQIEFVDAAFDEIFSMIESGKADFAISALTITEERQKQVDFTDYYLRTCRRILYHKDRPVLSIDDLKDKVIAVLEKSDDETFINNIEYKETITFLKETDIFNLLDSGEADAVIIDEELAKVLEAEYDDILLFDEEVGEELYAIALPKGREELLDSLNSSLATLKETGELDKIFSKYIDSEEKGNEE